MTDPFHVTTATEVKCQEKDDIEKLNEQLSLYVGKVRQLGDKGVNSSAFLSTLRSVEEEVIKLKSLYEAELDTLRRKLDDANKSKNDNAAELDRFQRAARDFRDRYQVEADKNGRLISDICQLQKHVSQLEHELADARDALAIPKRQLVEVKDELAKARLQKVEVVRELEQEKARSQQLKDKVDGLHRDADFKDQVHAEQLRDANAHVEHSKGLIGELESRARELESQNASLPNLLEKMKKKTEEDIRQYKEETTAAANRNISELKTQIADHLSAMEQLRQANNKLQADCDGIEGKVRAAEARAMQMQAQKGFVEEQLKHEKARSLEQTRDLERKLRDLNQTLMNKMSEINANNDTKVYLRAEIEAMRLKLEEEENRLGSFRNQASQSYATSRPVSYDEMRQSYTTKVGSMRSSAQGTPCQYRADSVSRQPDVASAHVTQSPDTAPSPGGQQSCGVSFNTPGSPYVKQPETEYQDSFTRVTSAPERHVHYHSDGGSVEQAWTGQHPHSVSYKQTRSRSCHPGFPKIVTDNTHKGGYTTGTSHMYIPRSYGVRGDGTMANSCTGSIRYGRIQVI